MVQASADQNNGVKRHKSAAPETNGRDGNLEQEGRSVHLKLNGALLEICQFSRSTATSLRASGVVPDVAPLPKGDAKDSPSLHVMTLALPEAVVVQFPVLKAMLDDCLDEAPELELVPGTLPFEPRLLVELLGCALLRHRGGHGNIIWQDADQLLDLLLAADFLNYQPALATLAGLVKEGVAAAHKGVKTNSGRERQVLVQGLDRLSADALTSVLENTTQAIQLQLNAAALSTWLARQSETAVNLSEISLDASELVSVLEALQLLPNVEFLGLDCSKFNVNKGFRLLERGLHKLAGSTRLRRLHLKVPKVKVSGSSRKLCEGPFGTAVVAHLIGVMSILQDTLVDLSVIENNCAAVWCLGDCNQPAGSAGYCTACVQRLGIGSEYNAADTVLELRRPLKQQAMLMPCLDSLQINGEIVDLTQAT